MTLEVNKLFDLSGQVAVVTGGTGVLCSEITCALAANGARVVILDRNLDPLPSLLERIGPAACNTLAVQGNVLDPDSLKQAAQTVMDRFGQVDILINGAGGNKPQATTSATQSFFDLPQDAFQWVFNLNFVGTLVPCQVFGKLMAEQGTGDILNISSMNAFRPLTRIPAYSAAKAAVSNFTQWLAVHMSQNYAPAIKVNAIAPGFFITEQNRYLLTDKETGGYTPRGQSVISHTPMARFGDPSDLVGAVLWLLSPSAGFVHGVVVPIDGGFSAFSGV